MSTKEDVRAAADLLEEQIERAVVAGAVAALDRRAAALRADTTGDPATLARRAGTVRHLEDCASDIARLAGPFVPLQGRLALPAPVGDG